MSGPAVIMFYVNGVKADQQVSYVAGNSGFLALTVGSGGTQTPTTATQHYNSSSQHPNNNTSADNDQPMYRNRSGVPVPSTEFLWDGNNLRITSLHPLGP